MAIELNVKEILGSYAQITIFVLMLSIGLSQGFANIAFLWRRPGLLARCLFAAFVLVPIAAMVINQIVPMSFPVRMGLAMMAICPGAPMIYRKSLKGRALPALAASFQVTMALVCVVAVPIWLGIISKLYPAEAVVEAATVFKQVASVQLVPIVLGMALREWVSDLADSWTTTVTNLGDFLFKGIVLVVLVVALPKVLTAGVIPVIGAVLFATANLLIGHGLGGPEPESRLTIAVSNNTRNAGLALALATLNFQDPGILGAIATYAVFAAVAGSIYTALYQKKLAQQEAVTNG